MNFQDITELPGWARTAITLLIGAGGAKLFAVWLENRRLEKKEYRDTLLGRIRELEGMIDGMRKSFTEMSVQLSLVQDENEELKATIRALRPGNVQRNVQSKDGSDAQPPRTV